MVSLLTSIEQGQEGQDQEGGALPHEVIHHAAERGSDWNDNKHNQENVWLHVQNVTSDPALVLTQHSHRQPAQGHAHGHASLLIIGEHAGQHAET